MPLRKTTDSWYPKVVTIDGSQGQESFMVVVDGSFQKRDRMGMSFVRQMNNHPPKTLLTSDRLHDRPRPHLRCADKSQGRALDPRRRARLCLRRQQVCSPAGLGEAEAGDGEGGPGPPAVRLVQWMRDDVRVCETPDAGECETMVCCSVYVVVGREKKLPASSTSAGLLCWGWVVRRCDMR